MADYAHSVRIGLKQWLPKPTVTWGKLLTSAILNLFVCKMGVMTVVLHGTAVWIN